MKVKEFAENIITKLINGDLKLDTQVSFKNEGDGQMYKIGTVSECLDQIGIKLEPIEDLEPGHYAVMDKKTNNIIFDKIIKI